MSETPISDSTPHNVADLGMQIRRLERQLNAAQQRIKRLEEEEAGDEMVNAYEEICHDSYYQTQSYSAETAALITRLKERIKRLEEAGDAVASIIGPPGSAHWADEDQVDAAWNNWRKAKEAKL